MILRQTIHFMNVFADQKYPYILFEIKYNCKSIYSCINSLSIHIGLKIGYLDPTYDDDELAFNEWVNQSNVKSIKKDKSIMVAISKKEPHPNTLDVPLVWPLKPITYDSEGNENPNNGRKYVIDGCGMATKDPASKMTTIRFTPLQHAKFLAIGGAIWVKEVLAATELIEDRTRALPKAIIPKDIEDSLPH